MTKAILNKMFENLLHIGNKSNYRNPKMKPYIYGTVNGIHVINLTKTISKIEEVKTQLKELHTSGKKILFVATKLQARDYVSNLASETGHYYVSEKWVPGLLTNFKTIKRRISTYLQLSKDLDNWAFDMLTKKEKAAKMLEFEKLDKAYKGVKEMKKIPDVVFVIDWIYEEQALREANSLNLTTFAVLNTNGDDTVVFNCIPANTNSVKSIEYISAELRESLSWKVSSTPKANVRKFDDKKVVVKKVSVEKTEEKKEAPVKKEEVEKKVSVEKTEEKKAPVKKEEVEKKVPVEKTEEKKAPIKKEEVAEKKAPVKKEEK